MEIILKKDWDESINAPYASVSEINGQFVGREKEIKFLTNDILRKNSGSILVYGYRGVGKTSLVNRVLWNVKEVNPKIIFVPLNAPQLEGQYKQSQDQKTFINFLIRRLYTSIQDVKDIDQDIKEKVESLYVKAIAGEYRFTTKLNQNLTLRKSTSVEKSYKWSFDNKFFVYLFSVIIGVLIQFDLIQNISTVWQKIISAVLFIPLPYIFSFIVNTRKEKNEEDINESQYYYAVDNDLANLEHDLEQLHILLQDQDRKVVYIIDELDKVNNKFVETILDYHKTLFTVSKSIFLLIGGYNFSKLFHEENPIDDKEMSADGPTRRAPAYTAFSSKYFIARPTWKELNNYLDRIIQIKKGSSEEVAVFKKIACFDAKNDFTDLINSIKDWISVYHKDSMQPIIQKDNFSFDEKIKAVLYDKWISIVDHKSGPSEWKQNENLTYKSLSDIEILSKKETFNYHDNIEEWVNKNPNFKSQKVTVLLMQLLAAESLIYPMHREDAFLGKLTHYIFDKDKLDEYLFSKNVDA